MQQTKRYSFSETTVQYKYKGIATAETELSTVRDEEVGDDLNRRYAYLMNLAGLILRTSDDVESDRQWAAAVLWLANR